MSEICAASSVVSESCASRFSASSRPHLLTNEDRVEGRERAGALRIELEHLAVRGDRVGRTTEALVLDLRHRHVERFASLGLLRQVDAALDDPDEIVPALRAHEELLEGRERFGVGGVDLEDVGVARGRVVDETELLVDGADLHPVVASELRVGEVLRDLPVELHEPLLRLGDLGDLLELEARVVLRRVFLERRRERVERARVVRERLGADSRDLAAERDALLHVGLALREDVEGGDELVPLALLFVDRLEDRGRVGLELGVREHRLERGLRAFVLRIEEEDLAVVLERARGVAHVLLERRSEAEFEVDQRFFVVVELDAATEHVDVLLATARGVRRGRRAR